MAFLLCRKEIKMNPYNKYITTADTDIVKQLQEIYKKLGIPRNGISKELQEILDLCKAYSEKTAEKNPYRTLLEMQQKAKEQLSTDIDDYEDISQKRLAIDKWYYDFTKTKPAFPLPNSIRLSYL